MMGREQLLSNVQTKEEEKEEEKRKTVLTSKENRVRSEWGGAEMEESME